MPGKKIAFIILLLTSGVFALYLLTLFSSVRCEPDDMIISLEFRETGFIKALLHRYFFYSFRPLYSIIAYCTIGYSEQTGLFKYSMFIYFIGLYALFLFSVYKLLCHSLKKNAPTGKEKWEVLAISNLCIAAIYFFTTEKIEIFGWLSASAIHLTPVVFIFFSTWLLIKPPRKTDYILLLISSFFIAGGAEHIPAITLSILGIICIIYRKNILSKDYKPAAYRTVFLAMFILAFLLINLTNPGMKLHLNEVHDPNNGFASNSSIDILEMLRMFLKPHKLISIALSAGLISHLHYSYALPPISKKIKLIILSGLILSIIITALSGIIAYNSISIGRMWLYTDVLLLVLIISFLIKVASLHVVSKPIFYFNTIISVIIIFFCIKHSFKLIRYANHTDEIVSSLQKEAPGKIITIHDFPEADMSNQVLLSADPNYPENQLFCRFYNIPAKVSVKP